MSYLVVSKNDIYEIHEKEPKQVNGKWVSDGNIVTISESCLATWLQDRYWKDNPVKI